MPDGVAKVALVVTGGKAVSTNVEDNVFTITAPIGARVATRPGRVLRFYDSADRVVLTRRG